MKTKIVLDADVIIHFTKGSSVIDLLDIFPEYEYLILDVVYDELCVYRTQKINLDNILRTFPQRISLKKFSPEGESRYIYAHLRNNLKLGKGESACMVYCKDHYDVLGSSNLKDICDFCTKEGIAYLTTIDFLYYAYIRKKMTLESIERFIAEVRKKGSRLPDVDIIKHRPSFQI